MVVVEVVVVGGRVGGAVVEVVVVAGRVVKVVSVGSAVVEVVVVGSAVHLCQRFPSDAFSPVTVAA